MFSFFRFRKPEPAPPDGPPRARRLLFLDDDASRAEVFLAENPEAVWVQTAAECIVRLEESWDEVHLDHDLGGEHFVDLSRDDCGMEVVRWLSLQLRPHLSETRFQIHSHNPVAATMMGMQMMMNGYKVQVRPFGAPEPSTPDDAEPETPRFSALAGLVHRIRRLFGREVYDDPSARDPRTGSDLPPPEAFDFQWQLPPSSSTAGPSGTVPTPEPPLPDSQNPAPEIKGQNA